MGVSQFKSKFKILGTPTTHMSFYSAFLSSARANFPGWIRDHYDTPTRLREAVHALLCNEGGGLRYTKWASEEDFQNWLNSQSFQHGHAGAKADTGPTPVATGSALLSFEVVDLS